MFFTSNSHLYMRDTAAGTTTRIDVPEEPGVAVEGGAEEAVYRGASPDGSLVFFSDPQRLTKTSGAQGKSGHVDLYVRDTLTGALTDLSPAQGGAAGEIGLMAFDGNATTIAFIAQGVLDSTPNARGEVGHPRHMHEHRQLGDPGGRLQPLRRARGQSGSWQAPHFVGRLSTTDAPDWGTGLENLGTTTMRFSPDGRHLAFMSQRPLTGYDNRSLAPEAEGARAEEVFVYDAEPAPGGTLRCVSCDPGGAGPTACSTNRNPAKVSAR